MKSAILTTGASDEPQSDLFQGMSPKEILDNLESMAHIIKEESYLRPLTEEELTTRKDNLVKNTVELRVIAEEKAAVTAELNGRAKRLGKANSSILDDITQKAVRTNGKVFNIICEEDKRWVDLYNENGVWLRRRRADSGDAQTHISMRLND